MRSGLLSRSTKADEDFNYTEARFLAQLGIALSIITTALAHIAACYSVTHLNRLRRLIYPGYLVIGANIAMIGYFIDALNRCRPLPGFTGHTLAGICVDVDSTSGFPYFQEGQFYTPHIRARSSLADY